MAGYQGGWIAATFILVFGVSIEEAKGGGGKGGGGRGGGRGAGGAAFLMTSGTGIGGSGIALIVVGCALAVFGISGCLCCCCKRYKQRKKAKEAAEAVLNDSRCPSPYPVDYVQLMDNSADPNIVNERTFADKCPFKDDCLIILSVLNFTEDGTLNDSFKNEILEKTPDATIAMQKILNPFARSPFLNDPHLVLAMASTPEYQKFFKDTLQNIPEAEKVANSRTVVLLYGPRCCQDRVREIGVDTMVRTIIDIERSQFEEHLYQDLPPEEVVVRGTHINLLIPGSEDLNLEKVDEELYYEPEIGSIHSPIYFIIHFYPSDHNIAGPKDQRNTLVCIIDM